MREAANSQIARREEREGGAIKNQLELWMKSV